MDEKYSCYWIVKELVLQSTYGDAVLYAYYNIIISKTMDFQNRKES